MKKGARVRPAVRSKRGSLPFKLIVTREVSAHRTEPEARAALRKLRPEPGALGVVIKVAKEK